MHVLEVCLRQVWGVDQCNECSQIMPRATRACARGVLATSKCLLMELQRFQSKLPGSQSRVRTSLLWPFLASVLHDHPTAVLRREKSSLHPYRYNLNVASQLASYLREDCLVFQSQASVLDKRTSAAVESLLSLRAGTPVREESPQWRPPSPASSVVSSPPAVAGEEVMDSSEPQSVVSPSVCRWPGTRT